MSTEQLYQKLGLQLKYFIGKRVNDPMAAEDILHDVFIKIHTSINSLQSADKLEKWIYQIARNAIIDYYRQKRQFVEVEDYHLPSEDENVNEDNSMHKQASIGLTGWIEELPEIYREAILLTEYQGLTQKELAEKMNISVAGAKSRVQRARKMLRDMLLQCCHFEYDKYGTVIDYSKHCCCCSGTSSKKISKSLHP